MYKVREIYKDQNLLVTINDPKRDLLGLNCRISLNIATQEELGYLFGKQLPFVEKVNTKKNKGE